MTTTKLEVGKKYRMFHSRKGKADVQILDIIEAGADEDKDNDRWIDVQILKGRVQGIGVGSLRIEGDTMRVRGSLATFSPIE